MIDGNFELSYTLTVTYGYIDDADLDGRKKGSL